MSGFDWRSESGPRPPDPRMIGVRHQVVFQTPTPTTVPVPPLIDSDEDLGVETEHIVRPFIVTGGRTRPTDERLRVETLVTAVPSALSAPLGFERRHIVEICQRPLSVAEIASSLGVPIGVVRVVIADLIAERLLIVHDHLGVDDYPSRSLLERIREGVRAL
ncbi:MAG: hypothetical protein JWL58_6829 [Streptosporangiaceae bacterium]|jgi:hypothetical protein|nr:hypothetical protein [Streptosporangiaceae bacterium]